ncbi:hypothetical protein [Paenibacillus sp. HJGM_3]|uniref:hypothetical protein n=1 Tax=Paenibacillus sp. HJGM_3 TaxID=3379816 RepID=UPI00386E4D5A
MANARQPAHASRPPLYLHGGGRFARPGFLTGGIGWLPWLTWPFLLKPGYYSPYYITDYLDYLQDYPVNPYNYYYSYSYYPPQGAPQEAQTGGTQQNDDESRA